MLENIADHWVFWTAIVIIHLIVLLKNPAKLFMLYVMAAILYGIVSFLSLTWFGLYGFYGWLMVAVLFVPFSGVPIIVMLVGGFFAGRWMAKL